jgi:HAD superfamily hydrolase (TIGR01509 family)
MISTLLFDFNNVLLFVEETTVKSVAATYQKIDVPSSWSKFFFLNTELLQFIKEHHSKLNSAILSASEFSLYQPEIKELVVPYFDHLFFAKDEGWSKDLPATYMAVADRLKLDPSSLLFVDDKRENVEAAQRAGLSTIHFTTNAEYFRQVEKLV